MLGLNRQRDEVSILTRDVESAQRAFEGVSQRSAQTRLESLSVQTNTVILSPASEPTDPSRPKTPLNVLVALVLGTLLGTSFALLQEILDRRVRAADDLALADGVPLLAAIDHLAGVPAPARARRRRRFSFKRISPDPARSTS